MQCTCAHITPSCDPPSTQTLRQWSLILACHLMLLPLIAPKARS